MSTKTIETIETIALTAISGGITRFHALGRGCLSGAILGAGVGGPATFFNPIGAVAGAAVGCVGGAMVADRVVPHST